MDETIELILIYRHKTENGLMVSETPESPNVWLPLSEILEMGPVVWEEGDGQTITVTIPVWLAEDREFI